jgi:hypothetical protein
MPVSTGILALIKDRDQTHALPLKDRMCYKRGDIVQIFGPGRVYVVPPAEPFYLIEVTGVPMTVAEIQARYYQNETEGYIELNGEVKRRPSRRRLYWVNLDTLPTANKNDLTANRYTLIAWNKLRSSVTNKVTGQVEG